MMDQWYCRSKKGETGPFSRDELRYLLRTGVLPASGEVKCGLKSDWVALQDSDFVSKVAESAKVREQKQDTHGDVIFGAGDDKASNAPASPPRAASAMALATFQPRFASPDQWIAAIIVAALLLLIAATTFLWNWQRPESPSLGDGQSLVSTASERGNGDDSSNSTGMDAGDQTQSDSEASSTGIVHVATEEVSLPVQVGEALDDVAGPSSEEMSLSESLVPEGPEEEHAIPSEEAFRIRLPSHDEIVEARPPDGKIPTHPPKLQSSNLGGRVGKEREAAILNSGGSVESERAVALALKWLKSIQQSDGSWSFQEVGRDAQRGSLESSLAATSMAALCFLGAGNTTLSGPETEVVRRAFDFLSAEVKKKTGRRETMYVHALVMMAFSELAAMEPSEKKAKGNAQELLGFIEESQDPRSGGWRYQPRESGDLSVTGWQIMALQSGKTCGLSVSDETITKSHTFLDSVSSSSGAAYSYTPGNSASQCMTAVGLLSRIYLGWPRTTRPLQDGIESLSQTGPDRSDIYFNYYATVAIHHFGGEEWENWNQRLRPQLVESQVSKGDAAGSWIVTDPHGYAGGQVYQTCLSVLCLEVYYRYLPMFDDVKARPEK